MVVDRIDFDVQVVAAVEFEDAIVVVIMVVDRSVGTVVDIVAGKVVAVAVVVVFAEILVGMVIDSVVVQTMGTYIEFGDLAVSIDEMINVFDVLVVYYHTIEAVELIISKSQIVMDFDFRMQLVY